VFLSGFATAGTQLGLPDFGYLTQTEMAEVARRVCDRSSVPVLVDADTGYGNPLNVVRTVRLLESAGAAGMVLEDQVWPKRCGHLAGKRVVPADDSLAKVRAALDARDDLFVVARTDARGPLGLQEACARANAAAELGADAVLVEGLRGAEEYEPVAEAIPAPVRRVANMVESGVGPLMGIKALTDLGFSMMLSSVAGLFAASQALLEFWRRMREDGSSAPQLDRLIGFDRFAALVGTDDHYDLEHRYVERVEDEPS
jgi:2-methylisocitrate lyase-like PEP mutase family enzyme